MVQSVPSDQAFSAGLGACDVVVASALSSKVMRVLVVEDEKKAASFIRRALQAEGFAVR
jgi:PleD family two-component response regulator